MTSKLADRRFMQMALTLSWAAKGTTSPNPTVGAVLVKDSRVIATGVTQKYGGFHAERMLLSDLGLEQTKGSTLYVTLEPCSHQGKTPPCTDIILEKKIRRVVVAILDPNPLVAGQGVALLKAAGIEVDVGLLSKMARAINQDFFVWITEKRPFVTLKYAMTLDGKMASESGDSKWITHARSRRLSHLLRFRSDAILVGANTVIHDNPRLDARLPHRNKALLRIILDPLGKTPPGAHVMSDAFPTLFCVKPEVSREFKVLAENQKKEVWEDTSPGPLIYLPSLLNFLYMKNIQSLFVEGGASVLGGFLADNLGDKLFGFMGNQILGAGLSPFAGFTRKTVKEAVLLDDIHYKNLKDNLLFYGNLQWNSQLLGKDSLNGVKSS